MPLRWSSIPDKDGKFKFYREPAVYLARYAYRLQEKLPHAGDDLDAAVKLAPTNATVLLTAADAAQREVKAAAQGGDRQKVRESYARISDYCERAIAAAPADPRAYQGLGEFYRNLGDLDPAIQVWRRGLKEVKLEIACIGIDLDLADALIQQGHLQEAETVMKNLEAVLAKLDVKTRMSQQRLVDLRTAKLLFLRGHFDEAIQLLADLTVSKDIAQDGSGTVTPQAIYEAWMLLGQSHAALKHWDPALAAYQQAALLQPRRRRRTWPPRRLTWPPAAATPRSPATSRPWRSLMP